jgi:N-acylneuraminate cytidylyltransferase
MAKPLTAWPIEAASAGSIDRIVVSTDDEEIASVARTHQIEVIRRPAELATSESPTLLALQHVVEQLDAEGIAPPPCVRYATSMNTPLPAEWIPRAGRHR